MDLHVLGPWLFFFMINVEHLLYLIKECCPRERAFVLVMRSFFELVCRWNAVASIPFSLIVVPESGQIKVAIRLVFDRLDPLLHYKDVLKELIHFPSVSPKLGPLKGGACNHLRSEIIIFLAMCRGIIGANNILLGKRNAIHSWDSRQVIHKARFPVSPFVLIFILAQICSLADVSTCSA